MTGRLYLPILLSSLLLLSCTETVREGEWKNLTFMDCNNVLFKVAVKLTDAVFDNQTQYLRVDGVVKNRLDQYRQFNIRNWVYRLDEQGHFLKPQSVGLPVVPLAEMKPDGTSREEKFTIVFKMERPVGMSGITLDYADQFFMTGQINRIILSIPLQVTNGTVSSRG